MAEQKPATQGLTIYLLKSSSEKVEDAIRENIQNLSSHRLKAGSKQFGHLFVQQKAPKPPKWARFFANHLDPKIFGVVSNASAVLFMESAKRRFAVTFGQGRHLLEPDCWEERFGLRVALNSIGEQNIRSIYKSRLDPLSVHSRSQASREGSTRDFEIDIEQDILRAITGSPTDTELGRRLSGMDALKTAIPTDLESLHDILSSYYKKYQDTTYQKTFPWVDQIAEVKRKGDLEDLNNRVIQRIKTGDTDRIWMALPDVLEWERIDGFRYGKGKDCPQVPDIHLPDLLKTIDVENLTKETLTKKKVLCVDDDGVVVETWAAYRCLYAEIEEGEETFLLTCGRWFKITTDFVDAVNKDFKKIPKYPNSFLEYQDKTETDYNHRVATTDSASLALMDKKNIPYGGGHSLVEFCDLYSKNKDIIHVKRYGDSARLSHMFSQGLISGESFQMDSEFRRRVNSKLPSSHKISDHKIRPNQNEYKVVFAVISDAPGPLLLPFFSRLNLRNAARRLRGFGYQVALAKIEVEEKFKLLKRFV